MYIDIASLVFIREKAPRVDTDLIFLMAGKHFLVLGCWTEGSGEEGEGRTRTIYLFTSTLWNIQEHSGDENCEAEYRI